MERGMKLSDANALLEPGYAPLESGYCRLEDGQLHVAAWTTMFGCKGRMVEWWFGFLRTTEQYKWWHPKDHVWCEWIGERGTGRFIGGTRRCAPGLVHWMPRCGPGTSCISVGTPPTAARCGVASGSGTSTRPISLRTARLASRSVFRGVGGSHAYAVDADDAPSKEEADLVRELVGAIESGE